MATPEPSAHPSSPWLRSTVAWARTFARRLAWSTVAAVRALTAQFRKGAPQTSFWPGAILGSLVSLSLWLWDLLSLGELRFAGASDAEVQSRVIDATSPTILALEMRLLVAQLGFGFLLGALTHWTLATSRRRFTLSAPSPGLIVIGVTLTAHLLALFGMMARYPQLFADRWWLSGGLWARMQRSVTHGIGPLVFDALLTLLWVILLLGAAVELGHRLRLFVAGRTLELGGLYRVGRVAVPAAVALMVALGLVRGAPSTSSADSRPPDVLILASDSLRADRLESSEVMPFAASLLPDASLFRYAFTPIARTYPSWVSTLTGTEPRQNGVRHMFPLVASRQQLSPTFFTRLRDEDYYTFVVSDFAGDVFHGFEAGFETVDTPALNVDTLAASTVLSAHQWTLPLLRLRWARKLFPVWRNLPSLADPEWLVEEALGHVAAAGDRPYAAVVFFSAAHFPYVAPYPDYLPNDVEDAENYEGPYLYHVPPEQAGRALSPEDEKQVRARYDGALTAIDRAMERLHREVSELRGADNALLVITGDHGEELYETPGIAGHGDVIGYVGSQSVPVLLRGPGVPEGIVSSEQVRLYDLGATVLELALPSDESPRRFGEGVSLLAAGESRPICVETGIWFWPTLPAGLVGDRLEYPGIAALLDLASTREMVLRTDMEALVETSKERGLVLGNRLWRERLTPRGLERELQQLEGLTPTSDGVDLAERFEHRCIQGDPNLTRMLGAVLFARPLPGESTSRAMTEAPSAAGSADPQLDLTHGASP